MNILGFLMRFARDTRGVAAVEMVLMLPVSVLMLFITMEAGHYLYVEHALIQNLRDSARFGARQPFSAFNCTSALADTAMPTSGALGTIGTNIKTLARFGELSPANGALPPIKTWDATEVSIVYGCTSNAQTVTGIYKSMNFAPYIKVYGTPEYPTLFGSLTGFAGTMRLFGKQQAVVVGL